MYFWWLTDRAAKALLSIYAYKDRQKAALASLKEASSPLLVINSVESKETQLLKMQKISEDMDPDRSKSLTPPL